MGTRSVTLVKLDEEYKVAKYCQWDGYPKEKGRSIVDFITKKMDIEVFKERVKTHTLLSPSYVEKLWKGKTNEQFKKKYPYLTRDLGGGEILEAIQSGKAERTMSDLYYAKEAWDVAYTWEVDLDNEVLKMYEGALSDKPKYTMKFKILKADFKKLLRKEAAKERRRNKE
jgi:hypothetical protein